MKCNGLMSNIQSVQVHINRPVSESFWQLEINLELGVKVIATGAHTTPEFYYHGVISFLPCVFRFHEPQLVKEGGS